MSAAVRRLEPDDWERWLRFVADIPPGEERFLKEDMANRPAFERWVAHPGWLVALEEDKIAGAVAALAGTGWSAHVAELRLIVAGSRRGRGLGRQLAHHGLLQALAQDCSHVYVEVVAEQSGLVSMFRGLGFQPEALLADFVRDREGHCYDLMLLTHRAADNWSALAGLGLAEAST